MGIESTQRFKVVYLPEDRSPTTQSPASEREIRVPVSLEQGTDGVWTGWLHGSEVRYRAPTISRVEKQLRGDAAAARNVSKLQIVLDVHFRWPESMRPSLEQHRRLVDRLRVSRLRSRELSAEVESLRSERAAIKKRESELRAQLADRMLESGLPISRVASELGVERVSLHREILERRRA